MVYFDLRDLHVKVQEHGGLERKTLVDLMGTPWMRAPSRSNVFYFYADSGKTSQNNMFATLAPTPTPICEILVPDSPLKEGKGKDGERKSVK